MATMPEKAKELLLLLKEEPEEREGVRAQGQNAHWTHGDPCPECSYFSPNI